MRVQACGPLADRTWPEVPRECDAIPDHQSIDSFSSRPFHGTARILRLAVWNAANMRLPDKPGCTTLADLARVRAAVETTGRIWSVDFSERFEVPSGIKAQELVT
jgi:hypothetical protein